MIAAYILVYFGTIAPIPPLADSESCQRVLAALSSRTAQCVRVLIPAPSDIAWRKMENK